MTYDGVSLSFIDYVESLIDLYNKDNPKNGVRFTSYGTMSDEQIAFIRELGFEVAQHNIIPSNIYVDYVIRRL